MEIDTHYSENNIVIITPHSRIEDEGLLHLSDTIKGVVSKGNYNILINLIHLNYMGSSGIGMLIEYCKILKSNTGCLKICNANNKILNVIKLLRLDQLFEALKEEEIMKNQEEAIKTFFGKGK